MVLDPGFVERVVDARAVVRDLAARVGRKPAFKCFACAFGTPICACDENGCTASNEPTHVFDLMRLEDAGDEILTGPDPTCGDCTVRLVKAE